jgi:phosphatidylethanolamine-binding protein (PEBP) family uncharacterized protein
MLSSTLFIAALIAVVSAQTPPSFTPAVAQQLQVSYGAISASGNLVARPSKSAYQQRQISSCENSDTAQQPTINIPSNMISSTAKALLVMIDLDVPRNNQRVTNLHWLAPNVDISNAQAVVPNTAVLATYLQPSPPPGDTAHRYVYLMYAQPGNFSTPAQFQNVQKARLGFDINAFAMAC